MTISDLERHMDAIATRTGRRTWKLELPQEAYDALAEEAKRLGMDHWKGRPSVMRFNFPSGSVGVTRR